MPFFFIYLVKLSVSLAVVFLFYHFVLRKLTFYNWNRWYLLGYTLLSFFIPFIDISAMLAKNEWTDSSVVQWVPVISNNSVSTRDVLSPTSFFTTTNILALVIIIGMLVLLVRLLIQVVSFRKMMKKAQHISGNDMKIYQVDENIIPFSFGNSIFINLHLHSETELQEIIRHEFVHVKQIHSLDIIWGEILCLLNWYNPFAWLIKKSIRQNLEFIADNKVLENGVSKKEYQYLLLKVIGNNQYSIATQFNFSSLKKRIAMMNKNKSAKVQVVKFIFLVPIAAVILLAFRSKYERMLLQLPHDIKSLRDTVPHPPAPPAAPEVIKLPENVEKINVNNGNVSVWLKNGNKEKYNLNDIQQKMEFDKKYGKLPEPPPPPELPKGVKDISLNGKNIVTVTMENGKTEKFDLNKESERNRFETNYGKMPEPPPIPPIAPRILMGDESVSRVSNDFEITDKKAIIHLNDGTTENYNLTDKTERKQFEERYGKIINVNANVNSNINMTIDASVTPVASSPASNSITSIVAPVFSKGVVSVSSPSIAKTNSYGINSITPIASLSPAGVIDDYGYAINGKEDIVITITSKTTPDHLEQYKKQMKEKGVELDFDEIEYENGVLVKLTGTMKSGNSHSNFVAVDFNKLVLAMIKKGEKTWFKVGTTDNSEVI